MLAGGELRQSGYKLVVCLRVEDSDEMLGLPDFLGEGECAEEGFVMVDSAGAGGHVGSRRFQVGCGGHKRALTYKF
jgi:hypothetical protein